MSSQVPPHARLEIKFVAREIDFDRVYMWVLTHPLAFRVSYPSRWVNNIYFDTHNFRSYSDNLFGASSRYKTRYRWYGRSEYPGDGALEIKSKRNTYGWKKRYPFGHSPYKEGDNWSLLQQRLTSELPMEAEIWMRSHPQVSIMNRYHRHYLATHDERVRITFDTQQKVFDQRYKPYINTKRASNHPSTLVVEFKFLRSEHALVSQILGGFPIRVSRNSKYVVGVKSLHGL